VAADEAVYIKGKTKKITLKIVSGENYCATNSGSPEVGLRFCPWLNIVQILNRAA
jgi:hypothetical protein